MNQVFVLTPFSKYPLVFFLTDLNVFEHLITNHYFQEVLIQRLDSHISSRIIDKSKHSHWCLEWARKNIPQMSAIMTLFNHTKKDIECLDSCNTLLSQSSNFLLATNSEAKLQGAYLYYDTNDEIWVRSGKVSHRDFSIRHNEHQKSAASLDAKSRFYCRYHIR